MKYIKLFEKFTKDYMKKIDLKDFKKIKKGSKILYMGGPVEVLDNNGYVLKLKGEDGKTFTINKSQFDHGGMIKEVDDGKKKKKKKPFHPDMMYEAKGKKVISDLYKMDGQIDYISDADDDTKKIWKKAGVNPEDDNMIILYSYVNSWPETKKLLDKSRIKYKELEDPNSAGESFIVFNVDESVNELRSTPVSGTMAGFTQSLEDRKYELKKDVKGAKIGSFVNVTLPKGTIIYNLPGGVFADHFSLKNKYASRSSQGPRYFDKPTFKGIMITSMPDTLAAIEKNSKVLESFDTEINEGSDQQRLTHLRKFGIAPNNQPQNGAYIKQVSKPGKFFVDWKDAFDLGDVALEFVKSVGSISEFDIIDLKTMKRTGKQLDVKKGQLGNLRTTYGVRVNESSSKDGGDKSNGNSHHDDHQEKSIAQEWKDTYGEEFHSKYPAVAKIIKQRNIKDKRELSRIWQDTYGENFEEQYPALFNKLD